jgi:hypothetical protein
LEQGVWTKWDNRAQKTDSLIFEKGSLIKSAKYTYYETGTLHTYLFSDPGADYYLCDTYNEKGVKTREAQSNLNSDTVTLYENGKEEIKQLGSVKTQDAEFPGGIEAFKKYIENNLNLSPATIHGAPHGTYVIALNFIINKDGSIGDVSQESGNGYGIEQEAIRVIKSSPPWIRQINQAFP